jgi:hypothetical protein
MTVEGTAKGSRLFSIWGNPLYFDADGQLRHGSGGKFDAFLIPQNHDAEGTAVQLAGIEIGTRGDAHIAAVAPDQTVQLSTGREIKLELVELERGLVALRSGGLFLCAEQDGRVTLSRTRCGSWETFLSTDPPGSSRRRDKGAKDTAIDWSQVKRITVNPRTRVRAQAEASRKILVYGYLRWSHGRVYYDLSKFMWQNGIILDLLDWQTNHNEYMDELISYYDKVVTAPDGVKVLSELYGIAPESLTVISHSEYDLQLLLSQENRRVFERFDAYAVVSHTVYAASITNGIARVPRIVPLGVDFDEFSQPPAERLTSVGYASSMKLDVSGVDIKRGHLAKRAAESAGLEFKAAGSTANQTSFHDMPEFYRSVGSILMTSVTESGPLPVLEAAAAGRLVIGTPVGHFPLLAYCGGGVIAPIDEEAFVRFAADTLDFYKNEQAAYDDLCHRAQEAARAFDWSQKLRCWTELFE